MFIWGGSVCTASGPIPVLLGAGINRKLCQMVQEGRRQLRLRRSLLSGLECIIEQTTHELLGVSHVEVYPGVVHQSEMLLVLVIVHIGKQPRMPMEPNQQ